MHGTSVIESVSMLQGARACFDAAVSLGMATQSADPPVPQLLLMTANDVCQKQLVMVLAVIFIHAV